MRYNFLEMQQAWRDVVEGVGEREVGWRRNDQAHKSDRYYDLQQSTAWKGTC